MNVDAPKKLTIGMATYDDFHGVYFTLQALRMYHAEEMDNVSLTVVDNNPKSKHGLQIKKLFDSWLGKSHTYIPYTKRQSTAVRNLVFETARTPYVCCVDCHVMLWPDSVARLIRYFDMHPDCNDLLQGPLVYDNLRTISTHFNPIWGAEMYGKWGTDKRGLDLDAEPFEIPMQGLGQFACRKDAWLGFNNNFTGFGGEEGYIHEKFRQAGAKTLCLPFLRWMHRFGRPDGTPYRNQLEDRTFNYFLGWGELGLDTAPIKEVFGKKMPAVRLEKLEARAAAVLRGETPEPLVKRPEPSRKARSQSQPVSKPKTVVVPETAIVDRVAKGRLETSKLGKLMRKEGDKPNIFVFGVGHSGTSILTRMLHTLGWDKGDADKGYAESVRCRKVNMQKLRGKPFNVKLAANTLANHFNPPWAIKDPRFVLTLPNWKTFFQGREDAPLLLWIHRDIEYVERSYRDRGYKFKNEAGLYSHRLTQLYTLAEKYYDAWPWAKVQINFEEVMAACELFNTAKATRRKAK